ncbi:hypothetical protein D3C87_2155460 [compost metagenome]
MTLFIQHSLHNLAIGEVQGIRHICDGPGHCIVEVQNQSIGFIAQGVGQQCQRCF